MTAALSILYRDDDVVVVDKPADLLVHRTDLDGDDDAALQRVRDQIGQWLYPVHRLDRPTSGVLAFALSPAAAGRMAADFRGSAVAKHYLAIVRGWAPAQGVIDRPLKPSRGRPALASFTRFVRLAATELPFSVSRFPTARYSLVMAAPVTGRRHQIRRHFKGISHPIIGDVAHGDRHHNRLFRQQFDCHRLLLHAWRLAFRQPTTSETVVVHAPVPACLRALADRFGWDVDESTLATARTQLASAKAEAAPGDPRATG